MSTRKNAICAVYLLLAGCAAKTAPAEPAEPASAETTGVEQAPAPLEEEAPEQARVPSSAPARLTIVTKVANAEVRSKIKVTDPDGNVLAEGTSGAPLDVKAGDLDVEATPADASVLVDRPSMHQTVTVEPGAEAEQVLSFPYAKVRVRVLLKGKLDPTATVILKRNEATVAKLVSGNKEYVTLSPGRYSAKVTSKRAEITVSDVIIMDGATQDIPMDVQ